MTATNIVNSVIVVAFDGTGSVDGDVQREVAARTELPGRRLLPNEEGSVSRMIGRLCIIVLICSLVPASAWAQRKPGEPAAAPAPAPGAPAPTPTPAASAPEIKLDETTSLKAAALEAQISALLANFALLQRQAQDIQQEMTKMLEER